MLIGILEEELSATPLRELLEVAVELGLNLVELMLDWEAVEEFSEGMFERNGVDFKYDDSLHEDDESTGDTDLKRNETN